MTYNGEHWTDLEAALSFDAPTLLSITVLVVALSGGLLILAQVGRRDTRPIGMWGAAMLLGALGLLLVVLGQGTAWLSGTLGTAAILAATAVSWTAARVFTGRPPRPLLATSGVALWILTWPLHSGSSQWLALACTIGAGYTLAAAAELWPSREERLPSQRAALVLLVIHASFYAARGAHALFGNEPGDWDGIIRVVLPLECLLHSIGLAFVVLIMVRERVELHAIQHLRALALQDGLTGLGNRRHFDEHLEGEVRRARRLGSPVALLLIDVDHFKMFNDTFGHPQGDACLRAVADLIAGLVSRTGDLAARYGGEEFAVLLTNTDVAGASNLAETIRKAVMVLGQRLHTPCSKVTISVGVAALWPGREGDAETALVHRADQALYKAKAGGRNQVWADGQEIATAA